jgi:hypothetical protein
VALAVEENEAADHAAYFFGAQGKTAAARLDAHTIQPLIYRSLVTESAGYADDSFCSAGVPPAPQG